MIALQRVALIGMLAASPVPGFAVCAWAERLPFRAYSTSDGLAHDRVLCVLQDSRGWLWFCTADGLSRFDGHRFVNYDEADGLPAPPVYGLVESPAGVYWAAAQGGLARFDARLVARTTAPASPAPSPRSADTPLFTGYQVHPDPSKRRLFSLLRDRAGRLWAGGDIGLFRVDDSGDGVQITLESPEGVSWESAGSVRRLLEDAEGSLWLGADRGLIRRTPAGRLVPYGLQAGGRLLRARSLLEGEAGTLWIGTGDGLVAMSPEPAALARGLDARSFSAAPPCGVAPDVHAGRRRDGAAAAVCQHARTTASVGSAVRSLFRAPGGAIWVGAVSGLLIVDGARSRTYTEAHGLPNETINAIAMDRAGNIWLGTDIGGALRIPAAAFSTYDKADGLVATDVFQIGQDTAGVLYAMTLRKGIVHRFDGHAFRPIALNIPGLHPGTRHRPLTRRPPHPWWVDVALDRGALSEPFDDNQPRLFGILPHSSGDVWFGEHAAAGDTLMRWDVESQRRQPFDAGERAALLEAGHVHSMLLFAEDRQGGVWIRTLDGRVIRFRDERFSSLLNESGEPLRGVKGLSFDLAGRLWIGIGRQVWRVDEPGAPRPRAARALQGASLGRINCLTIDSRGRLYVGTPQGVEQVDPGTGRILRRYTRADGLPHNEILAAFRDRAGTLWFGTYEGLSRFVPPTEREETPPPAFITGVAAGGKRQPVAELGETSLSNIALGPGERQIAIAFGGLAFGVGDPLRFQYRLVGAEREWSPPVEARIVSYAQLARGAYRFEVRAVGPQAAVSPTPAVVSFEVPAPIWARWWFITLLLTLAAMAAHRMYSARSARLVELERIRTRIAADLHDDIGANLSRIAMMAAVAQRHAGGEGSPAGTLLASVAAISRESVDAMSDIVWAVDPARDRILDLSQRMRRLASDVLAARDIAFNFRAPDPALTLPLGSDVRREVLLIFKEALNNAGRHSGTHHVDLELGVRGTDLALKVADTGCGFDPAAVAEGNGLASMRRRAARIRGTLDVRSAPGRGTVVELRARVR